MSKPDTVGDIIDHLEKDIEALKRWNAKNFSQEFLIAHLLMETAQLWLQRWAKME